MIEGAARALARMIVPRAWRPSVASLYERVLLDRRNPRRCRFSNPSDTVLDCCIAYNDFGGYCVPLVAVQLHWHRPSLQSAGIDTYDGATCLPIPSCGHGVQPRRAKLWSI